MDRNLVPMGERLRAARKQAGITSEDAAKVLGVSRPYLSQLENSRRKNVSPEFLVRACFLYEVTTEYLLGLGVSGYFELQQYLYLSGQMPDWFFPELERLIDRALAQVGVDGARYCEALGLHMGPIHDFNAEHDLSRARKVEVALDQHRPDKDFGR